MDGLERPRHRGRPPPRADASRAWTAPWRIVSEGEHGSAVTPKVTTPACEPVVTSVPISAVDWWTRLGAPVRPERRDRAEELTVGECGRPRHATGPLAVLLLRSHEPTRTVFTLEVCAGPAEPLFVASTWTKVTSHGETLGLASPPFTGSNALARKRAADQGLPVHLERLGRARGLADTLRKSVHILDRLRVCLQE